ncbi:uncharacterized protein J4E92_000064 [Alternaria infectoria]|uniref:uncharacterized protein n=1 Tax=Alternaria infectoria TaxID=45303 RepID=UPI00221FF7BB|nr:uncharacterized protein J4E92_000064 [Alternaria infectoria]KAI4938783.1 hypothetical protein J4E92_000064 [Alternaria infectoria]
MRDYNDDGSGAQDRELTHEEKVRRCLADSPSPTGSPMRQDDSPLTIAEWKAKSEESDRKAGVEYVRHSQTKELFRVDRREKESMGNYITTLEAEAAKVKTLEAQVARLKEQMASMQAEKDKKILALESGFKALGLDTQATATPAPTIAKCDDEVKVANTGEKVEMMEYK